MPQRLFDLLLELVRANGAIVSRETLYNTIWPEGGVGNNNLSQHIYMLRRALGERAGDSLYIATVHDRGFRFVAPISVVDRSQSPAPVNERAESVDLPLDPTLNVIHGYIQGCRLLEYGTAEHLLQAAEQFEATLANDPRHALSLVGLARAHLLLAQNGYCPGTNEFREAKDAVIRALQLAPKCAAAHAVLSNIILFCDWNWRDAKRELDIAVQLNSQNTIVRASAVWVLAWIGQAGKAVSELVRAITNEASWSPGLYLLLGRALIDSGDYERAIEYLSGSLKLDPALASRAMYYRAEAQLLNGQPAKAIRDLLFLLQDRQEDFASRAALLGVAYAQSGDVEKSREVYETLLSMRATAHVPLTALVPLALGLGLRNQALHHFGQALAQREPALPLLRHSPWIDSIRKSDSFKSLLTTIAQA